MHGSYSCSLLIWQIADCLVTEHNVFHVAKKCYLHHQGQHWKKKKHNKKQHFIPQQGVHRSDWQNGVQMVPKGWSLGGERLCVRVCVCETEKHEPYMCMFSCMFNHASVCTFACVCVWVGVWEDMCASLHMCVKQKSMYVVYRVCVSAYFWVFLCVFVCMDICCTPLSHTFSSHTQVCPSVYFTSDRREWQEVKQAMSTHVCLCDMMRCVLLISWEGVFCVYVCVPLTAHRPDGSCDVQAFNCISKGLIGVCRCLFPPVGFKFK